MIRTLRRLPVTLAIAVTLLVVAVLTGAIVHRPASWMEQVFGTGIDPLLERRAFLSPITSIFVVANPATVFVLIVAVLTLVGASEHLLGWWRTLIAYFGSAVVGVWAGIGLQQLGILIDETWAMHAREADVVIPFAPIAGTLMTASAFASALWKRRIRVIGFSVLVTFALYSGEPADLFRLLVAVAGLGIGLIMAPARTTPKWQRSSHAEARTLLAAIVAITALGPLITIVSPAKFGPLHSLGLLFRDVLPHLATVRHDCGLSQTEPCLRDTALAQMNGIGPELLTLMPLIILLVCAVGLMRGKRFSAWLAIAVSGATAAFAANYYLFTPATLPPSLSLRPRPPLETTIILWTSVAVPLIVALLLVATLRHFSVRTSRRTLSKYLLVVASSLLALSVLYVAGGWLTRDQFQPPVSLGILIADLPGRFVPVGFLGVERIRFVPEGALPRLLYQWVGPLFWLILIVGALVVARSMLDRTQEQEHDRARALLTSIGGGSLSFMTTWAGNRWWFAEDGKAAIAYRVINRIAITTSDPLCTPANREPTARAFATFCDDNGWNAVFYSVHGEYLPVFEAMGWSTMMVAEETVLRPATWSMSGPKWQDVRTAINRAQKLGVRAEWTAYERLPLLMRSQIQEISELWVAERSLPELGFTLGGVPELRDPAVGLLLAIGPDEHVEAVTSWMPSYRDEEICGWTLDFMRRRPGAMNGVMEFLIASAVMRTQPGEIEFVSLSAAPLIGDTAAVGASTITKRLLSFLANALEPVYGFRSLLNFKKKFQPEFHQLFMAYADPLTLPAIGTALAHAYLPETSTREMLRFVRGLR